MRLPFSIAVELQNYSNGPLMTQLIEQFAAIVGVRAVIAAPQDVEPYASDRRRRYFAMPLSDAA